MFDRSEDDLYMHRTETIKSRMSAANTAYATMNDEFKTKLITKETKLWLCKSTIVYLDLDAYRIYTIL